jgi:hypothetical protein
LWVRPLTDTTGKYRQTSPEFFRFNPAMTYRCWPWLNRELKVLQDSNDNPLPHVLEQIQRLITHFHIRSRRIWTESPEPLAENQAHTAQISSRSCLLFAQDKYQIWFRLFDKQTPFHIRRILNK